MRKRTPNWRGYWGIPVGVLVYILFAVGTLNADSPSITVDNSYEREETYEPAGEIVTETFNQDYRLIWGETLTDRLDANFELGLTIVDTENSNAVDTKELTPNLDMGLVNPTWTLNFTAEDAIEETNELNVERKDTINLNTTFDFSPEIFPVLSVTYDIESDDQENLADSRGERLDLVTDYSFGDALTVDLSYQIETFDDRLNDNSDTESNQWDVGLSYNQSLNPVLKLNVASSWAGEKSDTLNNAGQVLATEESENLENSIQLTFESFPRVSSDLEVSNNKELVQDTDETEVSYSFETTQEFLGVGDLQETFEITVTDSKSPVPQDDSLTKALSLGLDFSGSPSKWIDYSVAETMDIERSEFQDSSLDTDTEASAFDISVTINPTAGMTWDTAFNWTVDWEDGVRTGEGKDAKIDITLEGEALHVPNLEFNPSFNFSTEEDLETAEKTTSRSIDLEFAYTFNLPPVFTMIITPTYRFEKQSNESETEEIDLGYETDWEWGWNEWAFTLSITGDYNDIITDDEARTTSADLNLQISSMIFGNLGFDIDFQYAISSEDDSEASLEFTLDWELYNMSFSLTATGDRTFDQEESETRSYLAEFLMDF